MTVNYNKKPAIVFLVALLLIFIGFLLNDRINSLLDQGINEQTPIQTTPSVVNEGRDVSLPKEFPQYPGSQITDRWMKETQETTGSSFVLQTQDAPGEVYEFYRERVEGLGWTIQEEDGENNTLMLRQANTQGFLVISQTEEDATLISITFAVINNE